MFCFALSMMLTLSQQSGIVCVLLPALFHMVFCMVPSDNDKAKLITGDDIADDS
jgi:hypothetical protein